MMSQPVRRSTEGFSLLELILAILIFQVGILGVAGMVLTAQRTLTRAQLILRGTLEAREVGDSILSAGAVGAGEMMRPWGGLSWTDEGPAGLKVVATMPGGEDTLAVIRVWPPVGGGAVAPDSLAITGGGEE
jgi:Tfp pilus assembly protein PilV